MLSRPDPLLRPLFPMPEAREAKPAFETIPPAVLQQMESLLGGGIISGDIAWGGLSAAAGFILTREDGRRFFVKGSHPEDLSHATENLRQEIKAYQNIPLLKDISPPYIGCVSDGDEDGWMLGIWDYVPSFELPPDMAGVTDILLRCHREGSDFSAIPSFKEKNYIRDFFTPDRKWQRLRDEADVGKKFISVFESPATAKRFLEHNLKTLCETQDKISGMNNADVLIHGDLRPDNILSGQDGRTYFIDWPNICHGPKAFDLLFLGAGLEAAGQMRMTAFFSRYEQAGGFLPAPQDMMVMAVCLSGFFACHVYRPVPPKLPRLRWMQKSLFMVWLEYLCRQGLIDSIPVMS